MQLVQIRIQCISETDIHWVKDQWQESIQLLLTA